MIYWVLQTKNLHDLPFDKFQWLFQTIYLVKFRSSAITFCISKIGDKIVVTSFAEALEVPFSSKNCNKEPDPRPFSITKLWLRFTLFWKNCD